MVLDGKSSQEYPNNAEVPQGSIYGLTLFLLLLSTLSDQASDLWQQLELASELRLSLVYLL